MGEDRGKTQSIPRASSLKNSISVLTKWSGQQYTQFYMILKGFLGTLNKTLEMKNH